MTKRQTKSSGAKAVFIDPAAKAVFIDMDNTLIETQNLYEDAHSALTAFIYTLGPFERDDVLNAVRAREVALFDTYGYGREMLPHAFEDTLRHYVPDAQPAELKQVRDMAETVYTRTAEIKKGVPEALEKLAQTHKLYLVTVGDASVQQPRIDALPFQKFFENTFIVSAKNVEAYKTVLAYTGVDAKNATMIGDSLASDIVPALECGMAAIYVPAQNWHGREMAGQSLPDHAIVKKTFADAVEFISPQGNKKPAAASHRKHAAGGSKPS